MTDLFGNDVVTKDAPDRVTKVFWVDARVVREHGVDKTLQMMQVERTDRDNPLADWRDEMMRRTGLSESDFRTWFDWEVNIYGNKSLASFVWAIA